MATLSGMPVVLFSLLTWATFQRMPMIGIPEQRFLERFLPAEVRRHGATTIALGMVSDHVHLLVRLPSHFDLPRLVQGLKGASSRLVNRDTTISKAGLRWASGYFAFSVSPRNLKSAIEYVRRQAERHPDRAIPSRDNSALESAARRSRDSS